MGRWLAENTFTRVRVDGVEGWVHVDSVVVATVRHRTSRAGDPHRHVHYQISSRVHAAGRWRAVDGGSARQPRPRRLVHGVEPDLRAGHVQRPRGAGRARRARCDEPIRSRFTALSVVGVGSLKPSEFVGAGARRVRLLQGAGDDPGAQVGHRQIQDLQPPDDRARSRRRLDGASTPPPPPGSSRHRPLYGCRRR